MSTNSDLSGSRLPEHSGPFDQQQDHLLSILARRAGEPVTYDELRDAGIELPGSLVSELELAGVEVQRCTTADPRGRRVRAVRLPSTAISRAGPAETATEAPKFSPRSLSDSSKPPRRVPAPDKPPRRESVSGKPPHRESADDASVAPVAGWGAVRVYRGSLRRALAAGWVNLAHRRDVARFARYTPQGPRRRSGTRLLGPLALVVAVAITAAVVLAAVSVG